MGLIALLAFAAPGLLVAQPSSSKPSNAERPQIDVTVTDSSGRIVSGLTKADFEILRGGKSRSIEDFAFIPSRAGTPAAASSFNVLTWPSPFPAGVAGGDGHLAMILVIDDLYLPAAVRDHLCSALTDFLNGQFKPGDLVGIVRTSGGSGALQQLNSDKAGLHAALAPLGIQPIESVNPASPARDDAAVESALLTLRSVFDGLRGMPGRKSVVLFSPNLKLFLDLRASDRLLIESANRASAVFYTVDPRALAPAADTGSSPVEIPAGLGELARETGGIFFDRTHDAAAVLAQVLRDQEGYYRLSATTQESPAEVPASRGLIAGITVKLKPAALRVRTRTEFPENEPDGASDGAAQALPAALFTSGEIRVRVTPLLSFTAASSVDVLVHVELKDITLTRDSKNLHNGGLELVATVFSPRGQELERMARAYAIRVPDDGFAQSLSDGLTPSLRLPLHAPGPIQVQVIVRDTTSGRVGSGRQSLVVPDYKSGQLILSGIFLGTAAASGSSRDSGDTSAVRVFQPGQFVSFSYSIFNAGVDKEKNPNVELAVRVLRDGQQIYAAEPIQAPLGPDPDPSRRTRQGSLTLNANAERGHYDLVIAATDKSSSPPRTATQSIDFEVR